uniref:Uncharacterized protein n=1 Tax=Anguilla anguilla TaxID=7936 RepID=A0A0E9QQA0_ANGAN
MKKKAKLSIHFKKLSHS